jgi:hypothetical protein
MSDIGAADTCSTTKHVLILFVTLLMGTTGTYVPSEFMHLVAREEKSISLANVFTKSVYERYLHISFQPFFNRREFSAV